jgi:hypothetical protein
MFNELGLTITDLPKQVKIAREFTVLGSYPEAINVYKRCYKLIQG